MQDLSGTTIGPYELRGILGKGGMATVYRAYQPSMDRDVAVKVLSPDLADEPEFLARFEREARIIAQLQHPNILPVYDFGREGRYTYLVVRLIDGGTLGDELRGRPLPTDRVIHLVQQIAAALDYAHERGIVHRDLKPTNVLLDADDTVYLTDFGIAKLIAGSTITGLTAPNAVMGTPTYMAPEQWRSESVDARTDVYALGIMVYQMLLGKVPFASETPHGLMYQHLDKQPTPPRAINPALPLTIEPVIRKALAKAPHDRYASAGALAADLERALRFPDRMPEQTLFEMPQTTPPARPVTFSPEEFSENPGDDPDRPDDEAGRRTIPKMPARDPRPAALTQPIQPRDPPPRRPASPATPPPPRSPYPDAPLPGHYRPPVVPAKPSSPAVTGYAPPYRPESTGAYPPYVDEGGGFGRVLVIAGIVGGLLIILMGVILVSVLLLDLGGNSAQTVGERPTLSITAPTDGSVVALGSLVTIRFTCTSADGITRIELQRFDQVVNAINADSETTYEGWFTYAANTTGTHELTLVAYSGTRASEPVTLTIVVQ